MCRVFIKKARFCRDLLGRIPARAGMAGMAIVALTWVAAAPVFAQMFIEGRHYTVVRGETPPSVPAGKVEVREFFWYGCPHCYTLEAYLDKWQKPDAAEFVLTPTLLGKNWVDHAYAYYALKALGRLDELHPVLFEALHVKKKRLSTIGQMAKFFEGHGIKAAKFREAAESFTVATQVKIAERLAREYGISSVPTFVINGRYLTSPSMTGSYEQFFEVVDFLVRKEASKPRPEASAD